VDFRSATRSSWRDRHRSDSYDKEWDPEYERFWEGGYMMKLAGLSNEVMWRSE
jgi:hypothetical protein